MAEKSSIEWTDATWNPIVGCSIVSPGCTNCYAMNMASRLQAIGIPQYAGTTKKVNGNAVWTGKTAMAPDKTLFEPLRWKKSRTIFVNSMGDLFHESIPDEWIDRVLAVMGQCEDNDCGHIFQVLTKRAARMEDYLNSDRAYKAWNDPRLATEAWPARNVWWGVSAERQQEADERIPHLLLTPAAIRFVSLEPLLGPIDLTSVAPPELPYEGKAAGINAISEHNRTLRGVLDWIIVGGESGPNARPMHPDWARSIRDQCEAAGVAFFFKQWGNWLPRDVVNVSRDHAIFRGDEFRVERDWSRARYAISLGEVVCERQRKDEAGRLLDGKEHNAMPKADAA
jgi:protein gp37